MIPQTIPAGNEILTLSIDSKKYECRLKENYELESGTACELTLRYDPVLGINGITAEINDWKEGNKSEITPTEKEEKTTPEKGGCTRFKMVHCNDYHRNCRIFSDEYGI